MPQITQNFKKMEKELAKQFTTQKIRTLTGGKKNVITRTN